MERFESSASPDVLNYQKTSDALIKQIRKLRWMGLNDEIKRVEKMLAAHDMQSSDTVIADPIDTD
jgi:hypothetical protein